VGREIEAISVNISHSQRATRVTGHTQVKGKPRRFYAQWVDADGTPRTRTLGFAHVKDSGRRTPRGAKVWRAADGPCPDGHLTPKMAEDVLATILEDSRRAAPERPTGPTFREAVDAWLTYLEVEKQREVGTVQDARIVARGRLLVHFGAETPLDAITTDDVDDYRRLLLQSEIAPRTAQKILVLLHGIMKLAKRRKMIVTNPCEDAERVQVIDDGTFNVLDQDEFEDIYRAVLGELDRRPLEERREKDAVDRLEADERMIFAAILSTAFYAGPRMGELRDLPWRNVDFRRRMLRVESGYSRGLRSTPKGKRARSVPLVSILSDRLRAIKEREHYVGAGDYVFGIAGERVSDVRVRSVFYAALARAGFAHKRGKVDQLGNPQEPIRVHDLRHSYCTWAVNVWPLTKVKEFAGHRDIKTTMRYVHHQTKSEDADLADAFLAAS
jgi:integrase